MDTYTFIASWRTVRTIEEHTPDVAHLRNRHCSLFASYGDNYKMTYREDAYDELVYRLGSLPCADGPYTQEEDVRQRCLCDGCVAKFTVAWAIVD